MIPPGGVLGDVGGSADGGLSGSPGDGGKFPVNKMGASGAAKTSFAGCSGETGAAGISDKRFPQRVRASCSPSEISVSPL